MNEQRGLQGDGRDFDLVLAFPQWQGSGRPANLRRGAEAAAGLFGRYGPVARVPDAGEGEARAGINRWTALVEQFDAAKAILDARQPRRVLTAGGDCACDVAVIDHLLRRHPDLTVIWVDAHLDANTPQTSPSGSFHGMPVAALMGSPPEDLRPRLGTRLPAAQFRYVSAHLGDDGEWVFQRTHGLRWLEIGERFPGPVHIHFDLDALDPAEFPYVAYPEGRLPIETGVAVVRNAAASGGLVGLTITEFAPPDAAGAAEGLKVLERLCEAARSPAP
jgi:arginase